MMRWSAIPVLASVLAAIGLAAGGEPPADGKQQAAYHRSQGDTLLRARSYAEAEKEYLLAVGLTQGDLAKVRLYDTLATVARRQADGAKTVFYLKKACEAAAENREMQEEATGRLIGEMISTEDLKGAEEVAREAFAKAGSQNARLALWGHICNISTRLKKLDDLEKEADAILKKEQSLAAHLMLRAVYEAKGDKVRLLKLSEQIASSFPQATLARSDLAAALVEQGKMDEALPHLKALAGVPGHRRREFALLLAGHFLRQKNDDEARKWLAVAKNPDAEAYRSTIKVLLDAGRTDLALGEYGEAIANADEPDAACQWRLERAGLLEKLGRKDEAVKDYQQLARPAIVPGHIAQQAKEALARLQGK